MGMRGIDAATTRKLGPEFAERPALVLTYYDERGKDTKFYRLRYLDQPSGFAALGKPIRYAQPRGTVCGAYLPKGVGVDWSKLVDDVTASLVITEGEIKAAAMTVAGIPTIGLGGVFSWKSTSRGIDLIPALARVKWAGRPVVIAFDSDAASNPMIVVALSQLTRKLVELGAFVSVASLPPLADGAKAGLDDHLVTSGLEFVRGLLNEAEAAGVAAELWKMSAEVAYIKDPGLIIVRDDGRKMTPSAFTQHAYSHRRVVIETAKADGGTKLTERSLPQTWLEWPARFELERLTYSPGEPRVTEDGSYNLWKGWGCHPSKGSVKPWVDLLDYVFDKNKEARTWFEAWCAYPLQHPGVKMYSAPIFWGARHGTGKTIIGYTLMQIYGANSTEIRQEHLHSSFNEWAENKQFIVADEVTGSDKRIDYDRLKSFITQRSLRLNPKYIPSYEIPDRINYYFTSQHPDAFFLDDTDRRFFVWEMAKPPMPREFYRTYDAWMKGDGPAYLFDYLLHVDVGAFDPQGPALFTSAKAAMIQDAKSDLGAWVSALLEDPDTFLGKYGKGAELVTNSQLLALYDPEKKTRVTANGLGRELKRAGVMMANEGAQVHTKHGPQRLYILKNQDAWVKKTARQLAAAWEKYWC